MRWVVGVGLSPADSGSLEIAAWLHDYTGAELHAVMAVATPALALRAESILGRLRRDFADVLRARIASSSCDGKLESATVALGPSVERVLIDRAQELGAGLLLGRHSEAGYEGLVRLGRVTRRTLRHLPGPTGVVPLGFKAADLAQGPIVAAVCPRPDSLSAVAFARNLGREVAREVVLAHVIESVSSVGIEHLSPGRGPDLRAAHRKRARADLDRFVAEHGLQRERMRLAAGDPVQGLRQIAEDVGACAVVVGSRQLSTTQRLFDVSVASVMAGLSTMPVIVIPPDEARAGANAAAG